MIALQVTQFVVKKSLIASQKRQKHTSLTVIFDKRSSRRSSTAQKSSVQDQLVEAASWSCADADVVDRFAARAAVLQQVPGAVADAARVAADGVRRLRVRRRVVQRHRRDVIVRHDLEDDVLVAVAKGRPEHVGRVG